jgi:ribosomal subunit interface protein
MIANIEITGVGGYVPDESTKKYIRKRIGGLDKKATKHARKTMRAEVKLAEVNRDKGNKYEVEAIIIIPDQRIIAKDSTMNILAATDIVEAKLAAQLRKYKEEHVPHIGKRKLLDHFKRSYAREAA